MSTEIHIKLHREAIDLHKQLLHSAEIALNEDKDKEVGEFYSKMCDAVSQVLVEMTQRVPLL